MTVYRQISKEERFWTLLILPFHIWQTFAFSRGLLLLSFISYWQFWLYLSLGWRLMDLLVPGIQEKFCLGIRTILSERNSNSCNYEFVGYQAFPSFIVYVYLCFLKCIFCSYIPEVLSSSFLNRFLKKNKAYGEHGKKQKQTNSH